MYSVYGFRFGNETRVACGGNLVIMSSKLLAWLFRLGKRKHLVGVVSVACVLTTLLFTITLRRTGPNTPGERVYVFNRPRQVLSPEPDISFGKNIKFIEPSLMKQPPQRLSRNVLMGDSLSEPPHVLRWLNNSGGTSSRAGVTHPKVSNISECAWTSRSTNHPPYFLVAVVLLRIYETDKAKLTTREFKQWLEYVRYAGVEHVYVYDAYVHNQESQHGFLERFFQDKYITYVDWHVHNPYSIQGTQVAGYQHCIDNYGHEHTWQAAIDIDEYPFSPQDTEPGFLARFVKQFSEKNPHVSEITMQNYLFLGKPLEKELLFERIWRRTKGPANPLVKPIYKPANVRAQVHHNGLRTGRSSNAPDHELRLNHYWGARLQNWGDDTPEIIAKTQEDLSMEPIVKEFKKCEKFIRPYLE